MSNVRTVSDTKRAFYNHFDRPVVSVYRRVVEELMVEMHLLSVGADFAYDAMYALGIMTTFNRFMDGYRPEGDPEAIFVALCQSVEEASSEQYRNDAQQLLNETEGLSAEALKSGVANLEAAPSEGVLGLLKYVAARDRFKYSRAFGVGLYTVIEKVDPELVKDKDKLMAFLKETAEAIGISFDKLQKDVELYRSNLDKMSQAKAIMADMLEAERKKREERAQAKAAKEAAKDAPQEDSEQPVSAPADSAPVEGDGQEKEG